MFRQILISPTDSYKMRIIWRADMPLHEYELVTFTYGTDAALYQAIRVLRQFDIDNSPEKRTMDIIKISFSKNKEKISNWRNLITIPKMELRCCGHPY